MPKTIDSYRKSMDAEGLAKEPRRRIPVIPFAIGVIIMLFVSQAWMDSSSKMTSIDNSLAEKSKLCLVEFSQKGCDSLKPTEDCKKLLNCMEEKENWQGNRMR